MPKPHRIIILAAGASERMGRPKQLLPFRGRSLIMHVVSEAQEALHVSPLVVTGRYDALIRQELAGTDAEVVFNRDWHSGMASSIRTGVEHALADQELENVLIVLSDQPFVSATLFEDIFTRRQQTSKAVIASKYADGTLGTPVLFARNLWNELMQLAGHEGARNIVRSQPERVGTVDFPLGGVDIDTMDDFKNLPL